MFRRTPCRCIKGYIGHHVVDTHSSMPVGRMNHFYFYKKRSLRFKNNEEKTENEKVVIKIVRF